MAGIMTAYAERSHQTTLMSTRQHTKGHQYQLTFLTRSWRQRAKELQCQFTAWIS